MTASRAQLLAEREDREAVLAAMTEDEKVELYASWDFWARPEQKLPEDPFRWWGVVTGRGFGKNRTGSEGCLDRCEAFAAHDAKHLLGLMNATYADVRSVQIGGESGLEACAKLRGHIVDIPASKLEGRIRVWTPDGWHDTDVEVHTADQPDRVRGRNFHTLWADEMAKWRHRVDAQGATAFSNADFGLRALCPPGLQPAGIVTTTPKPIKLLKDLLAGEFGQTVITRGSLLDNLVNLDPSFVDAILRRYAGTRLGAQEIDGILLEDVEGALWTMALIEATRVKTHQRLTRDTIGDVLGTEVLRLVIGVDPSGGGRDSTCGIIAACSGWATGATAHAGQWSAAAPHMWVLEDASVPLNPAAWAREAIDTYYRWGADAIVFETNYGYKMGVDLIHVLDPNVNVEEVHASRGKAVRAEPIAALWTPEQARAHLVGWWPELEEQLTTWVPGDDSPDRLDGMVWCGHALLGDLTAIDSTTAYGQAVADMRL